MGADGYAVLVSKTDLRDFVTQIFITGFINTYFPKLSNLDFNYEEEEKEKEKEKEEQETDFLYNVTVYDNNDKPIMIELDLSEYKEIFNQFWEHTYISCQRDIPYLGDKDNYEYEVKDQVEYVEGLSDSYEIYYWDTEHFDISNESIIPYLYFNDCNSKSLNNFVNEYTDTLSWRAYQKEYAQFTTLFENKNNFINILKKVANEIDIEIMEEQLWT